jgi:hypothetical protein
MGTWPVGAYAPLAPRAAGAANRGGQAGQDCRGHRLGGGAPGGVTPKLPGEVIESGLIHDDPSAGAVAPSMTEFRSGCDVA